MRIVQPHEAFRLDFDQIALQGKLQESIHPANVGEYKISKGLYTFFKGEVLASIETDDWVYEAAHSFVTSLRPQYFTSLKLTGNLAFGQQSNFAKVREEVVDFLARTQRAGLAPNLIDLTKLSDFPTIIDMNDLPPDLRKEATSLYELAVEAEELQIETALRTLRDTYERAFPRVFFVVRRALKVSWGRKKKPSDNKLLQPSDYMQRYIDCAPTNHSLHYLLMQHKDFYKVARNVASHHHGLTWQAPSNTVLLEDESNRIQVHVDDFFQKSRYLTYFCELGVRGILAAFAERERGPVSNKVVVEYQKTFPANWSQGERGKVVLYPE